MKHALVALVLTLLPSLSFAWECNGHVAFGLPSTEDQLLCRDGYAVGYNYKRKVSAWVAYRVTKNSVEAKFKRSSRFKEDANIAEAYRSTLSNYKGSGYDRGHMAHSAKVDFSQTSMEESFLLSNMASQLPELNRQEWRYLEGHIREWAAKKNELYVATEPLFEGEVTTIGNGVRVPTAFYKAVYDAAKKTGSPLSFRTRMCPRQRSPRSS